MYMYVYNEINNYDDNLLFCYILCVKVSLLRSDHHRFSEYKLKRKEHTYNSDLTKMTSYRYM